MGASSSSHSKKENPTKYNCSIDFLETHEIEKTESLESLEGIETLQNYGFLPINCIHLAFLFLEIYELPNVMLACKLFKIILNTNFFWKEYYNFHKRDKNELFFEKEGVNNWKIHFFESFLLERRENYFKKRLFDIGFEEIVPKRKDLLNNKYSFDFLFKICLLGGRNSGRTSLLLRFSENSFSPLIPVGPGVDFKIKRVFYPQNAFMKLQVWDSVELHFRFRTLSMGHIFRGKDGFFLCFDVTKEDAFVYLQELLKDVRDYSGVYPSREEDRVHGAVILLCGTKIDLVNERKITHEMIEKFMKENDLDYPTQYTECSSKEGTYIHASFGQMIDLIVKKRFKKKNKIYKI